MTAKNKSELVDQILRALPKDILKRLPLPPNFENLPKELFEEAQSIFIDTNNNYENKTAKISHFVKSLSKENRALIRPQFHPSIEALQQEVI